MAAISRGSHVTIVVVSIKPSMVPSQVGVVGQVFSVSFHFLQDHASSWLDRDFLPRFKMATPMKQVLATISIAAAEERGDIVHIYGGEYGHYMGPQYSTFGIFKIQ